MSFLYLTADTIGTPTGGGLVTRHEHRALSELAKEKGVLCRTLQKNDLQAIRPEPWRSDWKASRSLGEEKYTLCHVYSGTFPETVAKLKDKGCRVVYTIAAHDRLVSRREHEKWGMGFPFPHLTEDALWKRYIEGYRLADVIVCPGSVPAQTVRGYGPDFEKKRIEVIPHGCEIPEKTAPLPERFVAGYLGAIAPDKGITYLLGAWKKLNYKDALLVLAGRDSTSPFARSLVEKHGGGAIHLAGWQKDAGDFYNSISLYVQPSASEGFGCEVLESMAHGRVAVCSNGAGAVDVATSHCRACDVDHLCEWIDAYKKQPEMLAERSKLSREMARDYTWDKVRDRYKALWKEVLA